MRESECDGEAGGCAGKREEQALGECLLHEAAGRCAEGAAKREFTRAIGGASEQYVGEVDARDEENEADGGEQDLHERTQVAEDGLRQGMDGDAVLVVGELLVDLRLDGGELGEGLGLRYAGAHESAHEEVVGSACVPWLVGFKREPDLGRTIARLRQEDRHDADDGAGFAVEVE